MILRHRLDKPEAHRPVGRDEQSRRGHRPVGLLSERGMGHSWGAGREAREILSVLRGTVRRHLLQHNAAAEDVVLHRQSDRALRGHIVPVGAGVLPASRLQGENIVVHHHPPVADHVLPAHLGNHTVHVAVSAAARQVPAVHHVVGGPVRSRHHRYHKHTLPVSIVQEVGRGPSFEPQHFTIPLTPIK